MKTITTLTRMWLTRSTKPFIFQNEYDQKLPYSDCQNLGLYVHIPFCRSICNFCPYCKLCIQQNYVTGISNSLLHEIHLVGSQHIGRKKATSLYIWWRHTGSYSRTDQRNHLMLSKNIFIITEGIGVELHPDNVTPTVLQTLRDAGVTKSALESNPSKINSKIFLGRTTVDAVKLKETLSEVPFETVSMDFIFALPNQTFDDLKSDIDKAFQSGANHIAIYPFIDFAFTSSSVAAMSKKEKQLLLNAVTHYCLDKGYIRTSIWTFSNEKKASYSSMTRDNFLGFGCSAATLLDDQFKINTFSVEAYCERCKENKLPTSLTTRFSLRQRMLYYLFWTAYSTKINPKDFENFFGVSLKSVYGIELNLAKLLGFLTEENGIYTMTLKGAFYYHYYENFYTLSYIEKMWGILREEAFPEKIEL